MNTFCSAFMIENRYIRSQLSEHYNNKMLIMSIVTVRLTDLEFTTERTMR